MEYEIGIIYKIKGIYYIAVEHNKLITFKNHSLTEFRPRHPKYEICRELPVEKLCKRWGISLSQLDDVAKKYFSPKMMGRNPLRSTRKRHTRNECVERDEHYYELRRVQFVKTRNGRARVY